ncbi:MAG TPA: ABC transporter ATP-binding protein [Chthonomonadales bacterium]|nr:ABC transporter ATP-binding protein [Chthonomonadales bacterium]
MKPAGELNSRTGNRPLAAFEADFLPFRVSRLNMSVASFSNLTVRYGKKTAISDLSAHIPEGSVGLLGPNGAGKTTLIKALLGFLKPATGRATVLGMDVAEQGLAVRQRIGLMPEIDCHIPGMNAVTFVAYAGELSGMPAASALRRAHEVLEYCGLGEARYRNIETYSTGMKQRIKLAQALVHGPHLLFLDEPTNGLDPDGRNDMLSLIRKISADGGVSVIVSSHLLPDIERTCDDVIVMRAGKIATQGTVSALRETQGMQLDVELRVASEQFVKAMEQEGAAVLRQFGSRYRISLDGACTDPGRKLFLAAKAAGAEIRGFQPAQRSLEDVFIEAVE